MMDDGWWMMDDDELRKNQTPNSICKNKNTLRSLREYTSIAMPVQN